MGEPRRPFTIRVEPEQPAAGLASDTGQSAAPAGREDEKKTDLDVPSFLRRRP
jgi:hypothetical protein